MAISNPTLWSSTLCNTGNYNTIPQTVDLSSGLFSFEKGFDLINSTPLAAGGKAPAREDFNGVFRLIGDNIYFLQHGGVYQYSADATYEQNAIIMYNGVLYQSLTDGNTGNQPDTSSTSWTPVIPSGNIDTALSSLVYLARICDKINASSYTPTDNDGEQPTPTQINTALKNILANISAMAKTIAANTWAEKQTFSKGLQSAVAASADNDVVRLTDLQSALLKAMPTGIILPFAGTTVPEGYLACNAANVSRATYSRLFGAIGTKWGAGDGSTTFGLPDGRDRTIWGANSASDVGGYLSDGLPNVQGWIVVQSRTSSYGEPCGGCFTRKVVSGNAGSPTSGEEDDQLTLDASKSSSIFGKSTKVQPRGFQALIIIKS